MPFFIFEEDFLHLSRQLTNSSNSEWIIGGSIILLLTSDIFLPIPSSLISTFSGYFFGLGIGTSISTLGMSLSCILAYITGYYSPRFLPNVILQKKDIDTIQALYKKYGILALFITRPIPVLAEIAVFHYGLSKLSIKKFLITCFISNLFISLIYAYAGQTASKELSFVWIFLFASLIPAATLMGFHFLIKKKAIPSEP